MSNVQLKGYKVSEIQFVNNLENGVRIELANKFNYTVNYSNDFVCRGEFSVDVEDKNNPDKFHIRAVILGIFDYKDGVTKEHIHVETFKDLFPYARALITTLTSNAGIPPIIIPPIDIESQSIYRFENNK